MQFLEHLEAQSLKISANHGGRKGEGELQDVTSLPQKTLDTSLNSLHHADGRKYFLGLSLTLNRREVHMFYWLREVRKNFIMVTLSLWSSVV